MFSEKKSAEIIKTPYNMKRCLRFFYFYILNIAQFWLYILMDDCHLSSNKCFFGKNEKKSIGIGWWTQDLESKTWKVTHNWWSSFFIQSFYQLALSTCHHSVQWTFMIIDFEYVRIHHTLVGHKSE